MNTMKNLAAIAAALALAVASSAKTPEEVATDYYRLVQQKNWSALAELYDPGALKEFRGIMSFLLNAPENLRPQLLAQFFGPRATVRSVSQMSDKEFFASFLGGVMTNAASLANFQVSEASVLGSVAEGDDLRHVVTRATLGAGLTAMESLEILSMKPSGDAWSVLLQGKMRIVAEQIRAALQPSAQQPN